MSPISTAYNQWTQFVTFAEFMGGVEQITQLDERNLHWKVSVGAQRRQFDAVIAEQHPEERVAWKSTHGKTHAGVVTFHKLAPEETRVTVQLDWEPDGVAEKAAAMVHIDDHQVSSDLSRFRDFIENRQKETGS